MCFRFRMSEAEPIGDIQNYLDALNTKVTHNCKVLGCLPSTYPLVLIENYCNCEAYFSSKHFTSLCIPSILVPSYFRCFNVNTLSLKKSKQVLILDFLNKGILVIHFCVRILFLAIPSKVSAPERQTKLEHS